MRKREYKCQCKEPKCHRCMYIAPLKECSTRIEVYCCSVFCEVCVINKRQARAIGKALLEWGENKA